MNTIEGSPRGTNIKTVKMNTRILLILLWVFYTVNFMYCDALSSLEPGVLEMTYDRIHGRWNCKNYRRIFVGNRSNVRDSIFNDRPVLGIKVPR